MKLVSLFLLSTIVLCASLPAVASSVLAVSLEQLSTRSELIFEGEVISVQSTLDPDQVGIHTYVTFRVDDVIKGAYLEDRTTAGFDTRWRLFPSRPPEPEQDGTKLRAEVRA